MITRVASTAAVAATGFALLAGTAVADPTPTPSAAAWPEPGHGPDGKAAAEGTPRTITVPPPGTLQENRKPYTPIEETTEGGRRSFTLQADVLFKSGSADLSDASERYLAEVAAKLKGGSVTGEVKVVGHTDDVDAPDRNLTLSRQRAESVIQALQPQLANTGITLVAEGKGETEPRDRGTTPQARQRNRRVSIVYGQANAQAPAADPRYITVPITEPAPDPGLRPLPGEPAPLASVQRTINAVWTVRLDVVELGRTGRLLKIGYRVRLVSQQGTDGLNYASLFHGDLYTGTGHQAQLIDKRHGEALSPIITGQGSTLADRVGDGDDVGPVQYGWAYFPRPAQETGTLSFYVPALGTIDGLRVK
ncbi:OmpA family protein [Thermomonospora umbrina]|uniref:Outer membrane protein OmpA-like peptidoglycan-associated protein n=1 Tax=Thermomonospora umbrina TaxID=111806 RepID=A0A3D9T035_9ACTN|nr:OmpA family protein [Thermomonospora umbrina]REE98615.1 outer membrane protein OmpA-like peptidoglycan-associated protein [Thermomonospora umbrina]